jgi:hypothetical protein
LAYRGIDVRDLYRRGSGLTPRRLLNLIRWLPYDDPVHAILREAEEKAQKPTADLIRDRAAQWRAENEARRAKEATG